MVKSTESIPDALQTAREKRWPYDEYYLGDRDEEERKNGKGENHWTGAESLEWYTGSMLHDTMHGEGDYKWRYTDPDGTFATYEGGFFANHLHGYGVMSYPDGRVFTGLFYNDLRWGPGEESFPSLRANVGLWRGTRLARLIWLPDGPTIVPDLTTGPSGPSILEPFRTLLRKNTKIVGEINNAINLLKRYGADPVSATEKWTKLYPKYCTDMDSAFFHKDLFEFQYYKGKVNFLEDVSPTDVDMEVDNQNDNNEETSEPSFCFAWNNNTMMLHMMKHSYQHEHQRAGIRLNLERVLNGPRNKYRPASEHEYDCRTLLMASYIGSKTNVTQLVNEKDVFPDVTDIRGNTPLMYAVCADQVDIIHFLIEAGASVNACNDSCCTALGIALLRYLCIANDVPVINMVQVIFPPIAQPENEEPKATEWHIAREKVAPKVEEVKPLTAASSKKLKSKSVVQAKTESSLLNKKLEADKISDQEYESDEVPDEDTGDRKQFLSVRLEYIFKCDEQNPIRNPITYSYLFSVKDMMLEINEVIAKDPQREKAVPGKSMTSKTRGLMSNKSLRISPSKNMNASITDIKEKLEKLSTIELTICQLLADGADPKLVLCPYPALLLALKSRSQEVIRHMVSHGVDINEKFPQFLNYTALELVISEKFSRENVELIRTLLELGADAKSRISLGQEQKPIQTELNPSLSDRPTLLHAVIWKKIELPNEEDICRDIIELLLEYNADPAALYKGHTPIEAAMIKNLDFLNVFIKNPSTNLNCIIDAKNHTILMKLFSRDFFKNTLGTDKFPILTNLLLYGADPLIESYDGDDKYGNVFEFANKTFNIISPDYHTLGNDKSVKREMSKDSKLSSKSKIKTVGSKGSMVRGTTTECTEYKESLDLMTECARLLHVRWIQAKLLKELIRIIYKFKHRHWASIIKEHNNANNVGKWVNTSRCIEIWHILETSHKKLYADENILQKLLCIVQFYQKRLKANLFITPHMKAVEKNIIEADVGLLMKEHKIASKLAKEAEAWKKTYVKPELAVRADNKFKICFECGLRLNRRPEIILCDFCGLVSFCNLMCLTANTDRIGCHPCSELLREKYLNQPGE